MTKTKFIGVIPVIPSANIDRDLKWYEEKAGFTQTFVADGYAGVESEHTYSPTMACRYSR